MHLTGLLRDQRPALRGPHCAGTAQVSLKRDGRWPHTQVHRRAAPLAALIYALPGLDGHRHAQ